jgi:hypothetical protein
VIDFLGDRFSRQTLKDEPFTVTVGASEDQVTAFYSEALSKIDPAFSVIGASRASMQSNPNFSAFLEKHTKIFTYAFMFRKCKDASCGFCRPIRMPTDVFDELYWLPLPKLGVDKEHYCNFQTMYKEQPTEDDLPSAKKKPKKTKRGAINQKEAVRQRVKISGQNARSVITCAECGKPRVVYANNQLSSDQLDRLDSIVEGMIFICGAELADPESGLHGPLNDGRPSNPVQVADITCRSAVEVAYYTALPRLKLPNVCYKCGESHSLQPLPPDSQDHPVCTACAKSCAPRPSRRKKLAIARKQANVVPAPAPVVSNQVVPIQAPMLPDKFVMQSVPSIAVSPPDILDVFSDVPSSMNLTAPVRDANESESKVNDKVDTQHSDVEAKEMQVPTHHSSGAESNRENEGFGTCEASNAMNKEVTGSNSEPTASVKRSYGMSDTARLSKRQRKFPQYLSSNSFILTPLSNTRSNV